MTERPAPSTIEYGGHTLTVLDSGDGWAVIISREGRSNRIFVSEDTYDAAISRAKALVDRVGQSGAPQSA